MSVSTLNRKKVYMSADYLSVAADDFFHYKQKKQHIILSHHVTHVTIYSLL